MMVYKKRVGMGIFILFLILGVISTMTFLKLGKEDRINSVKSVKKGNNLADVDQSEYPRETLVKTNTKLKKTVVSTESLEEGSHKKVNKSLSDQREVGGKDTKDKKTVINIPSTNYSEKSEVSKLTKNDVLKEEIILPSIDEVLVEATTEEVQKKTVASQKELRSLYKKRIEILRYLEF